jgi:hypothetical protein
VIALRDRKGRLWTGRLDVDAALRMRDLAGTDVMALALDKDAVLALLGDHSRLADVAFAFFLPQCHARGVDDLAFARGLRGWFGWWYIRPEDLAEIILTAVNEFARVPELSPGKPKEAGGASQPLTADRLWGFVWQVAGFGVDVGPRTLGELVAIADGRRKHDWAQTAGVMSYVAGLGGAKVTAADLDPTGGLGAEGKQELAVRGKDGIRALARIFGAAGRG